MYAFSTSFVGQYGQDSEQRLWAPAGNRMYHRRNLAEKAEAEATGAAGCGRGGYMKGHPQEKHGGRGALCFPDRVFRVSAFFGAFQGPHRGTLFSLGRLRVCDAGAVLGKERVSRRKIG